MKYALSVKQSLLFTDLSLIGCSEKYFKKALGIYFSLSECLIRGDDLFWNYDNDLTFDKAFLDDRTLNQAVEKFNNSLARATANLERVTKEIVRAKDWNNKRKSNLQKIFGQYIDAYLLNMPFLFQYWNVEHLLITQLKTDFSKIFGDKESELLLQQVLVPSQETYFAKERKSLEEIAKFIVKDQNLRKIFQTEDIQKIEQNVNNFIQLKKMLNKHIKLFGFTSFVLHLGSPLNITNLLERLNEIVKDDMEHKVKSHSLKIKDDKEKTEEVLKQIASNQKVHERVMLAQELMFWKNQRLDILFKSDLYIKPLFDSLAEIMNLTYQQFVYLKYEEINNWLMNNKKLPSINTINERMKSYCLYLKDGKISLFIDEKKYPVIKADSKTAAITKPNDNIIKGTTAYKGKISGMVRLIFSLSDIKKVKKGEILVTTMTRPEMIVGLEKAAAFVTDQGGMLCHAAIVSREMKKPCIVGTKIATKVLKDGDLVEVDADNGTVRIIKRT